MGIPVFLYLRRSTKGDEDKNHSIPAQERMGYEYCLPKDYEVIQIFKEIGGDSWDIERPVLNDMLARAEQGIVAKVIVVWIDRLARDGYDALTIKRRLDRCGVTLECVKQPIPPPPLDETFIMMLGVMGRQERQLIIQRIKAGRQQRIREGKLPASACPLYGYLWADPTSKHGKSTYVIDEEAANVVRLIFRLLIEDWSLRRIAGYLMEQGIESPSQHLSRLFPHAFIKRKTSHVWHGHAIVAIASNPAYAGFYVAGRDSQAKAQGITTRHPKWRDFERGVLDGINQYDYPIIPIPAVVSLEDWKAAQSMIGHHSNSIGRPRRVQEAALLTNGYAKCGYCSHHMQAIGNRGIYYYICAHVAKKNHVKDPCPGGRFIVSCTELDNLIWRHFMHVMEDANAIRDKFEEWKAAHVKRETSEHKNLEIAQDLLAEATRKKENYLALLGTARNDQERGDFLMMKRAAEDQEAAARREIARLEATIKEEQDVAAAMEEIIYSADSIAEELLNAPYEKKRRALYAFDVRVTLRRGQRLHPNATFAWLFGHPEALQTFIRESTKARAKQGKSLKKSVSSHKVRHEYGGAVMDWRGLYRGI
jgi:DNA invertase Pin-like site-specific DNA recombinase